MSGPPTIQLAGYRFVAIQRHDTLRSIALRELGTADSWRDLIAINNLVPPYITDNMALAGPQVLLVGGQLKVPSATPYATAAEDPDRVFGVDVALTGGKLTATNGDFTLVAGVKNLDQAITNRIDTPLSDLPFHPQYGCQVHELKGEKNTAHAATLGGAYVKGALLNDPRIDSVPEATVQVAADALVINTTAQPVAGAPIDSQTEV